MDGVKEGIISLVRSGITGESSSLPDDFDLEKAYAQLKRHQILPVGYIGAVKCGIPRTNPTMRKMFSDYGMCLIQNQRQLDMLEKIYDAFNKAEIDYLPLKGCNLKWLYPATEMRLMGDADILIRESQYSRIKSIISSLGFEDCTESDHEYVWKSSSLYLELHKRIMPSYYKDYYKYLGDGWELARIKEGTRYEMKKEIEFIYLFTHFSKHYREGGIGIKHATDLWVYRNAYPELDEGYIRKELEKAKLLTFYENIMRMLDVWFKGEAADEKTEFITDVIFASGAWGESSTRVLANVIRQTKSAKSIESARIKHLIETCFLPLCHMKRKYPVLNKVPVLLPVFWVVRIITVLLFKKNKIKKQSDEFKNATQERREEYEAYLKYVGLGYNFED